MSYIINNCDKIQVKVTKSYYSDLYIGHYDCGSGELIYNKLILFTGDTFNGYQSPYMEMCVPKNKKTILFSFNGVNPVYIPNFEYTITTIDDCSIASEFDSSTSKTLFVTPTPSVTPTPTPDCSNCITNRFTIQNSDTDSYVKIRYKDCITDNTKYVELFNSQESQIVCIKGGYEVVKNDKDDIFYVDNIENNICYSSCNDYVKCGNNTLLPMLDNEPLPNDSKIIYYNNSEISVDGCFMSDCEYDAFVLGWYYLNETTPRFTSGWNITDNRPINEIEYPGGVDENQSCSTGFTRSVDSGIWKVRILRRIFYINDVAYFVDSEKTTNSRSYFERDQYNALLYITIIVYPDATPLPTPTPTASVTPTPTPEPTPTVCYDCFTINISLNSKYAEPNRYYNYIYVPCSGVNIGKVVKKSIKLGESQSVCTFGVEEDVEGIFRPKVDNYTFLIRPFEELNPFGSKDNQAFVITSEYTDNETSKISTLVKCDEDVCINLSDEIKNAFIYPRPLSFGVEEDVEGI